MRPVRQPDRLRLWLSRILFVAIAAVYLVFQFQGRSETNDATSTPSEGAFEVFFSEPDAPGAASKRGGVDVNLAEAIDAAEYSVDVAVLRMDLWSIRDALINAHRRGVEVRVVTESDYLGEDEIEDLIAAGIPVASDHQDALMHHKFTIIDSIDVWTGSMNYTVNGAYRHNNNLLHIHSREAAADYTREFEEMFEQNRYGYASQLDTPFPIINIDGIDAGIYFSPDDMVAFQVINALEQAQERIVFMVYTLTLDPIADVIIRQAEAGLRVEGVMETDQAGNLGSDLERMIAAGVDLRLDGNPDKMHHKVIIIDNRIVITGSYNFSQSAEDYNDENLVIIESEELAQAYLAEYERIWQAAAP